MRYVRPDDAPPRAESAYFALQNEDGAPSVVARILD